MLTNLAFSNPKKGFEEYIYGWNLTTVGLDSTIENGFGEIELFLTDPTTNIPIAEAKCFSDEVFIGITNSVGVLVVKVKVGSHYFKITTPFGRALTYYQNVINQNRYGYEVKIVNSAELPPPAKVDRIQPCKP